VNFYKDVFGR